MANLGVGNDGTVDAKAVQPFHRFCPRGLPDFGGSAGLWLCGKGAQSPCGQVTLVISPLPLIHCSLLSVPQKQRLEFCLNPHPPGNFHFFLIQLRSKPVVFLLKSLEGLALRPFYIWLWHCPMWSLGSEVTDRPCKGHRQTLTTVGVTKAWDWIP